MLLLPTNRLPEGGNWQYELKLNGYRAIAFKSAGQAVKAFADFVLRGKIPAAPE